MTALEFNSKLTTLQPTLNPAAIRLTRDVEAAKDLIQDTLVKALSNREKFVEGTNLKAWVYTIMKNTFITQYHRTVKRKTFVDTTENLHFINSSNNSTNNSAGTWLALEEIGRAIEKLNGDYRTPFMMYYKGYKYKEISEILNIPIGTVKNRIHIARKELKGDLRSFAV